MNRHERGLEFKVGAFVFVGLAMLCTLVVQFGRLGEGFKTYYGLTIRFTDASGLLKGSDVLLAGAKIGKVSGGPRMVREGNGVDVPLKIYDYIKIPQGSSFTVGSSGLLGDRFVNVTMPPGERKTFIAPNSYISGARETGISDLTKEGGALVDDLRGAVHKIDNTVDRLNNDALSPGNMQNLRASIEHLSETSGALAQSSKKLDGVIEKADATMSSAHKAADEMQLVMADARKTVQAATEVFHEASEGKGALATLLGNRQLADDLSTLIHNLRAHGILFYRDSVSKIDKSAADQAKPTPRRHRE
jgi:phospholipid/cholesterol/gamma-HCH transport system substrate-binding protein